MEDLSWSDPYKHYNIVIYDKSGGGGGNGHANVIPLPNYGRESHTYLYHIIQNYDNLANLTIFLPGSSKTNAYNKRKRVKRLLRRIEKDRRRGAATAPPRSYFSCKKEINVAILMKFAINYHISTNKKNRKKSGGVLTPSAIRPYGAWFAANIGGEIHEYIAYNSIFAVSRADILQRPREFYMNLLDELNYMENPETGHYMERSWLSIFRPRNPALLTY